MSDLVHPSQQPREVVTGPHAEVKLHAQCHIANGRVKI